MQNFSKNIRKWYQVNKRDLPWRGTKDPFKIWLSEIILQQTRVSQGLNYYIKFTNRFEGVKDLAEAPEEEILSMWQGLGYYSRGRNLRKAAIQVMEEYNGKFPVCSKELIKLKGIGDYSAAAIASFSNNEKIAVVDGNVYRVLSRLFGIETPIDSSNGKKEFSALANALISPKHPAIHNQAIMEFGALQCTPKAPLCNQCVFGDVCEAYNKNNILSLPVKSKKTKRKTRYFHFHLDLKDGGILIEKRSDKDIWANLYQLPLIESDVELSRKTKPIFETEHLLSHQKLICSFYKSNDIDEKGRKRIKIDEIENYALPVVISKFLKHYFN